MRDLNALRTRLRAQSTGLAALCALIVGCATPEPAEARSFQQRQHEFPRYREAAKTRSQPLEARFRRAGAAWPPRLFVRAFKMEGVVELWAEPVTGTRWVRVRNFSICAASGILGPKRQQGDRQVPEGFYTVDRFNPSSSFHLSLGIDYPNAFDRTRTPRGRSAGGDIFIHGDCVTIGCLPLRDGPMEDLYVAAVAARGHGQRRIPVHIFPCRMGTEACVEALDEAGRQRPDDAATWPGLMPGYHLFETHRVPPKVRVSKAGYRVRPG